jgi:hypothetical protein
MMRFYHKFDLVSKFNLRGQLEGLNIIKKPNLLTSASGQRGLYSNIFYPFI